MTHLPLRRALSIAGIVVCATLPSTAVFAQEAQSAQGDDVGLLCVADQADRDSKNPDWNGRQVDWAKVRPRDAQRRQDLRRLMHDGRVHGAADDVCAGLIFQHGESVDDARLAYSMLTLAATLDPSIDNVLYLQAAAWDRLMMRMHRPQWYGTQFVRTADGGWAMGDVDESAVTDADRERAGVDPIAQARRKVERLDAAKRAAAAAASGVWP